MTAQVIDYEAFSASLERWQEDLYFKRINAESSILASMEMIEDIKEQIKTREMILIGLEDQLMEEQKQFAEDYGS